MAAYSLDQLVSELTLEEKAALCSGLDMWHTKPVERLHIPSIMMTDGPHGLRISPEPGKPAVNSTCFPAGCGLAASWNPELLERIGSAIGDECLAEKVSIILGPAVNIKRSPLCGRNFEYYSEDPLLSTRIATGHIKGVQSKGVGTSIKHYALNNQETERLLSDSICDERTMHEIYLASFEGAVKEAGPWTVMCSYNKINGTHASDHRWLLTDVLRKDWGYEGFVMTDWGALYDRIESIKAGLELEMPGSYGINDKKLVEAVQTGELDEGVLDLAVRRILRVVLEAARNPLLGTPCDYKAHHALARKAASECMVLLKNEDELLPLADNLKVAIIGAFAERPRYQGGGSSHIQPVRLDIPLEELRKVFPNSTYHPGYDMDSDETHQALLSEAVHGASQADVALVFIGLPDRYESEGYDRTHMRIPANQNHLVEEISRVQPHLAVVLMNGSPVEMPWIGKTKAVLEAYLGGQAAGGAIADILSGAANPSGKLAETFPMKLAHNPSWLNFPGESQKTRYQEGVFVGYRYYDTKEMDVLFPFGHGLSYSRFNYSDLTLSKDALSDRETVEARLIVENIGKYAGSEIVQLYVSPPAAGKFRRPAKELKAFSKVYLKPGEKKEVVLLLDKRSFALWNEDLSDWYVETGEYGVLVGASSRDIRLVQRIRVESTTILPKTYDRNTTLSELLSNPKTEPLARQVYESAKSAISILDPSDMGASDFFDIMLQTMPLRSLVLMSHGHFTEEMLNSLLAACNS